MHKTLTDTPTQPSDQDQGLSWPASRCNPNFAKFFIEQKNQQQTLSNKKLKQGRWVELTILSLQPRLSLEQASTLVRASKPILVGKEGQAFLGKGHSEPASSVIPKEESGAGPGGSGAARGLDRHCRGQEMELLSWGHSKAWSW